MQPESVERRLAAILIADVAGFSRLMSADEEGTLQRLRADRGVIDGLVTRHRGRIFASAGDSIVVEFASPVEAVRCALAIQRTVAQRNADVPPPQRMAYRIGINLGDVMVSGDNLYGDGVNVAARLETLGEAGDILIAASVHEHVQGKLDVAFDDLGAHRVKNIATPVRVFRVGPAGDPSATPAHMRRRAHVGRTVVPGEAPSAMRDRHPLLSWPKRLLLLIVLLGVGIGAVQLLGQDDGAALQPAVAVMPFYPIGGTPDGVAFSEGVTDDVITSLADRLNLRIMSVSAPAPAEAGRPDPRTVGQSLGVLYVLDGSVREAEGRLRISAQLVDAATGYNLWSGRYDRATGDVLAVQEEVAARISAALGPELTAAETARAAAVEAGPEINNVVLRALAGLGRLAGAAIGMTIDALRWLLGGNGATPVPPPVP